MTYPRFTPKDPLEELVLTLGFAAQLAEGETVESATWVITSNDPTDDTSAMLSGSVDVSDAPRVRQKVVGGKPGHLYLHRALAVTSTGRKVVMARYQEVSLGAFPTEM